jgi:hypothetical protein
VKPLSINLFPLSFEGEGDKGGEVSKHSLIKMNCLGYFYVKLILCKDSFHRGTQAINY